MVFYISTTRNKESTTAITNIKKADFEDFRSLFFQTIIDVKTFLELFLIGKINTRWLSCRTF